MDSARWLIWRTEINKCAPFFCQSIVAGSTDSTGIPGAASLFQGAESARTLPTLLPALNPQKPQSYHVLHDALKRVHGHVQFSGKLSHCNDSLGIQAQSNPFEGTHSSHPPNV